MKIAIDYDGTFSADPELFSVFIRIAQQREHEAYIVTMRYDSDAERICDQVPCKVFYTGRNAKMKHMADLGHIFDIWIDDMPHLLFESPALLWGNGKTDGN